MLETRGWHIVSPVPSTHALTSHPHPSLPPLFFSFLKNRRRIHHHHHMRSSEMYMVCREMFLLQDIFLECGRSDALTLATTTSTTLLPPPPRLPYPHTLVLALPSVSQGNVEIGDYKLMALLNVAFQLTGLRRSSGSILDSTTSVCICVC